MGRDRAGTEKEGKRQWEIKIKPERERAGWRGGAKEREREKRETEREGGKMENGEGAGG